MAGQTASIVFGPGQSFAADLPLSLTEGFSVMAGLLLKPRTALGRQTILLFEGESGEIANLSAVHSGGLKASVGQASVEISSADMKPYVQHWMLVVFTARVENARLRVELEVENALKAARLKHSRATRTSLASCKVGE